MSSSLSTAALPPVLIPDEPLVLDRGRALDQPAAARHLAYIDALRGFACLWVILCHVHGYWLDGFRPHGWTLTTLVTRVAGYGGKGVDLFIVLSGFCLYWPLVSKRREGAPFELKPFFMRRARRILPAYYAALAVCTALVLLPAVQPMLVARPITGADLVSHLFLVQTFSPSTAPSINGSFWSLALELQLYLAFPLLLLIGRRHGLRGIILFVLGVTTVYQLSAWWLAARPGTAGWASVLPMHLPARWLEFVAGMTAATLVSRPSPAHPLRAAAVLAILLPIGIIDQPLGMRGGAFSHALWGVIFAAAVVLLARAPVPTFVDHRRLGVLTAVGVISYSLYLVQQPFLLLTAGAVKGLHLGPLAAYALAMGVGVPVMCGIAYLMYRAFERPFLRAR